MVSILADDDEAGVQTKHSFASQNTSSTEANIEPTSKDEADPMNSLSLYMEQECSYCSEVEAKIDGLPYVMVDERPSMWCHQLEGKKSLHTTKSL